MNEFDKSLENQKTGLKHKKKTVTDADKKFYLRATGGVRSAENGGRSGRNASGRVKLLDSLKNEKLKKLRAKKTVYYKKSLFSSVSGNATQNGKYSISFLKGDYKRQLEVEDADGKSFKRKRNVKLRQDIVSVSPAKVKDRDRFACPECGETASLRQLEEGCKGCGETSFITDIFPMCGSYYCTEASRLSVSDIVRVTAWCCTLGAVIGIPAGIIKMVADMPQFITKEKIYEMIKSVFITPFEGAAIGFLGAVLIILGILIFDNVRRSPMIAKTDETRKKITLFMSKYDSDFSYDEFESRLIFLVQLMLYSDNKPALGAYRGTGAINHSIADSVYSGLAEFVKADEKFGICSVTVKVTMYDVYCFGGKPKEQKDTFTVTLERRGSVQPGISEEASDKECAKCGEHFDMTTNKKCPFCGHEYDMRDCDWTVTVFK